ncbi:MAG TPA: hypothetical protein VLF18_14465 [Tahibacter sp.]|uniref:sulfotransferase family protein n=1 Tax=Tahibacter sp. TaxID=2056211 RepID=UPI002C721D1C|nr:hypothetical protein [Tahibacter sp.]HSX61402.1 hypothetical protein [Tahibacter sp.]
MTQRHTAILVLGMHRSGTSALTRVLNLCGVDLGTHLMPPAADNNESGFWEHLDAVDLHERLLLQLGRSWSDARNLPTDWEASPAAAVAGQRVAALVADQFARSPVWAIKDPRLCRFVPVWTKALDAAGIDVKFIFALRHPDEVVASLARRDGIVPQEAGLLLLDHFFEAEAATENRVRCVATYQALLDDWRGCVARIGRELDVAIVPDEAAAAEIDAFLDAGARNHHAAEDLSRLGASLNGRVYRLAREAADSAQFWDGVAALRDPWDLYRNDLLPYVDELLDLLAVRDAAERGERRVAGGAVATERNGDALPALARLQFRMISGLQDGMGRLGQASADLGAMVRTGTEAALGAASGIASTVNELRSTLPYVRSRLDGLVEQAATLSVAAAKQHEQLGIAADHADALQRHIDAAAERSEARLAAFAADSGERLGQLMQSSEAAAAREHALLAQIEALSARIEAIAAEQQQRDEARWSRRLRRLLSGK